MALATLVVACGEDGSTPDCPALPLYNIKEDLDEGGVLKDPAKRTARSEAAAKNCVTLPGDASTLDTGAN